MSHEIRTPMNGILGFARLLQKPNISNEKLNSFIDIIITSSNQLLNIVNDILDISKIETGQIELYEEEINLNDVLKDIKSFFDLKASELGLDLVLNTDNKYDELNILADESKLKQIIYNLISNSLKFTKVGEIEFGYIIKDNRFNFYVSDTGIGIPKKYHTDIFNRFNKLENSSSVLYSGTGLGLSICKGLINRMGGEITVKSKEGKGTSFHFSLLLKEVNNSRTKQIILQENVMLINSTILIVEDEDVNAEYLKEILTKQNVKYIHAKNGVEAVEACKGKKQIDLVLMDIKMPLMDGFEATKKIKKINSNMPVIAQTAYAMKSDRIKAINAGCDDYISKPIIQEELFNLINKYLS